MNNPIGGNQKTAQIVGTEDFGRQLGGTLDPDASNSHLR